MSKPSAARSGSTAATPRKPPHDRGNSSYQAPNRARTRSTSIPSTGLFAASRRSRSESSRAAARHSSDRPFTEQRATLRQLSRQVRPDQQPACGRTRRASSRTDRPRPGRGAPTTRSRPAPPPPRSDRCPSARARASRQRRVPFGRYRATPLIVSWPSRKIVAVTGTSSPTHAFTGYRPQSTCGWTSWIWIRGDAITDKVNSLAMWLTRSIGVNLHPTSLPGGRLGPEAYAFVDWLAAAGARFWQVLPARSTRRIRVTVRFDVGVRGLGGAPRRSGRRRGAVRAAPVRGRERLLDRRLGRLRRRRRARRAGAVPARVVGAARLRRRARSAARSATCRSTSPRAAATTSPTPSSSSPSSFGCRRPTRRPERERAEVGQSRSTTGMRSRARATAGGSSGCDGCSASSTSSGSTTSAASPATGRCPPRQPRLPATGYWTPGPGAAVFRAAERELGELPVIVEDLGVITPDVDALRDELGFPGMAILLWAFQGPPDNPHRLENHRVHEVVYTSTHDTDTLAGHFPGRPGVGAARAWRSPRGRRSRDAGAGRARARLGGADESPRRGRRQLGLAARAGSARARGRRRLRASAEAAARCLTARAGAGLSRPARAGSFAATTFCRRARRRRRRSRSGRRSRRCRARSTPSAPARACPPPSSAARSTRAPSRTT